MAKMTSKHLTAPVKALLVQRLLDMDPDDLVCELGITSGGLIAAFPKRVELYILENFFDDEDFVDE